MKNMLLLMATALGKNPILCFGENMECGTFDINTTFSY